MNSVQILLLSLLIFFAIHYLWVSSKTKNYFNGLTIQVANVYILYIMMPFIWTFFHPDMYYSEYKIKFGNFVLIAIFMISWFIGLTSGYLLGHKKIINLNPKIKPLLYKRLSLIFFLLALFLYTIYLSIFGLEVLLHPRIVYQQTRLGFGPITFGLSMFAKLFLIFGLFYFRKKWLLLLLASMLVYILGSKSNLIMFFIIYFYYKVFIEEKYISLNRFILISIGGFIFLLTIYFIFSPNLTMKQWSLVLMYFSQYADYNFNFSILIDKLQHFYYGLLALENNLYAFLPRFIYPDKPTIYGVFKLSYLIFPEATLKFTGAPSFGIFGPFYADFGYLGILFIFIKYFLYGYILGAIENSLKYFKNPFLFMLLLIYSIIPIISAGIGGIFVDLVNIIIVLSLLGFYKIKGNIFNKRIVLK